MEEEAHLGGYSGDGSPHPSNLGRWGSLCSLFLLNPKTSQRHPSGFLSVSWQGFFLDI